ncbi:ubiquitin regulatory protein [Babesia caballi]|uniref:Ubiquitin regulatory protein n=1 Tax=Babesia caballi TaxID=5871 RepID=A0AAV4M0N9_BABCB|nr:ubiquitin regulatory protein [Babesia caballi]
MLIDLLVSPCGQRAPTRAQDRNFVLYVEHANGPMMRYLINLLDVRRLPHLSVMIMESEADCSVIARIEDFSNTDAVIQTIIRAAGNPARIPGARFENLEADRQLMDEQDEEYRKAVKADAARMRTQQLREHNDLRRRKQREEVAVMRERIVCDRRAYAQRFSGAQPTGDTKIKVRLPNGSTVSSTFNKDDTVEKVYLWVGAAEYISGSSVQIPYRFDLYLPHPSKMLGDRTQTLESANLFPNATLVLISRDESDDEDV